MLTAKTYVSPSRRHLGDSLTRTHIAALLEFIIPDSSYYVLIVEIQNVILTAGDANDFAVVGDVEIFACFMIYYFMFRMFEMLQWADDVNLVEVRENRRVSQTEADINNLAARWKFQFDGFCDYFVLVSGESELVLFIAAPYEKSIVRCYASRALKTTRYAIEGLLDLHKSVWIHSWPDS